MEHVNLIATIEALKDGNKAAFESIYYRFYSKLTAFVKKLVKDKEDVDEVVQEAFVKLWEKRHCLDPQQNLDGYIFRIARNIVYNKARHQVHEHAYAQYLAEKNAMTENLTDHYIDYQELNGLLKDVCSALPPVRKQVFEMSRIEGLSNGEIAEIMQTSTSNIENHISKALRDIRKKFEAYKIIYLILIPILILC
ncbi:RNA polymerase sigma-70 factor [Pontibacter harenae]|uniref:RNA polymerase sigma-70 factor n=1 Tax=Pontibacter harenae TaxID=2894083 RepID=UPI001E63AB41|nr:RNA polymerase sigma-70 factor [Pontibacter harenae]MCC9167589.1 RNA polymerase sigma-70 factor [Pontibacter harenae]